MVVKMMKVNEIRSKSVEELEKTLVDLKKDLFMLRMQHATNHLDNPTRISATRRDIARVKTVLREKHMNTERTTSRKTRVGKVVSDKMDKTVVVIVEDRVAHKTYKKIIGRTYRLKAHDENNECGVGDIVRVMETRPLSHDKRWRVVEIVEKAK